MRFRSLLVLGVLTQALGIWANTTAVAQWTAPDNPLRLVGNFEEDHPSIGPPKKPGDSGAETGPIEEVPSRPRKKLFEDAYDPPPNPEDEFDANDWLESSTYGYGNYGYPYPPSLFNGLFVRAEALAWSTTGLDLPALVTTSPTGTTRANAGVLGVPTTTVLFGGESVNNDVRSGGRITFGTWLGNCRNIGIEGEYFALDDATASFTGTSTGNPILARPFFNMLTGRETAELVAFPNLIRGTIQADAVTSFQGAGARFVYPLCSGEECGSVCYNPCMPGGIPQAYRFNVIAGYRFLRLDDSVSIREDLVSLDPTSPGSFLIQDNFQTQNQFHGAEIGMLLQGRHGRWTIECLTKVGIGNNHGVVTINGSTAITESSVTTTHNGGILAQRTNSGEFTQDQFTMIPELGITLGCQLTSNWRVTCGYTLLYWGRVLRAGDQIDLDVNPNLFPVETTPFTGPLRPEFDFHYTDLVAQGVSLGLEGRW